MTLTAASVEVAVRRLTPLFDNDFFDALVIVVTRAAPRRVAAIVWFADARILAP